MKEEGEIYGKISLCSRFFYEQISKCITHKGITIIEIAYPTDKEPLEKRLTELEEELGRVDLDPKTEIQFRNERKVIREKLGLIQGQKDK